MTNTLLHPTLLGRKDVIEAAGGYRSVPAEDWDLWMRLALQGSRLARIAMFTLLYRRHAGQVTANAEWRTAHAVDSRTADVHKLLAEKLLGWGEGAYAALHGVGSMTIALELLDAVYEEAGNFGWRDRIGVRTNALIVRRQTRNLYLAGQGDRAHER